MDLAVPEDLPLRDAHAIAEEVRHAVLHGTDGVSQVTVHVDPWSETNHRSTYHAVTAHHDDGPARDHHGDSHDHGSHGDHHDHSHDAREHGEAHDRRRDHRH
jgi:hypothetical protein